MVQDVTINGITYPDVEAVDYVDKSGVKHSLSRLMLNGAEIWAEIKTENTITLYVNAYEGNTSDSSSSGLTLPINRPISGAKEYAKIVGADANKEIEIYYTFDVSSIPVNANILDVKCTVRALKSTSTTSLIKAATYQLYNGSTAMGASENMPIGHLGSEMINIGTWTRAMLDNCRLRLSMIHGATAGSAYIKFYGAELTITYET